MDKQAGKLISQGKGNTRPDPERQTGKSVETELGKETQNCNSMKFPKPRTLSFNDHDDLSTPQPKLFKELVNDIIFPPEGSPRDRLYHRERILETSTLSCNEEEEEITKPPKR